MKEYIVAEHPAFPYEEPIPQELIRCNDCKYNPENAMSYLDDDLIEGYIHCGHLGDEGFCSLGKRKGK